MSMAVLSGEKENLFDKYNRREISFDQLSQKVYEIDHPPSTRLRKALKILVAAVLPLLFVGPGVQRNER